MSSLDDFDGCHANDYPDGHHDSDGIVSLADGPVLIKNDLPTGEEVFELTREIREKLGPAYFKRPA
jgi:hypothetical protein